MQQHGSKVDRWPEWAFKRFLQPVNSQGFISKRATNESTGLGEQVEDGQGGSHGT